MFEKLLFKTILEQAIAAEEVSYQNYVEMAKKPEYETVSHILKSLAGQELLHRIKLEELQRDKNLAASAVNDDKLQEMAGGTKEPFRCPKGDLDDDAALRVLQQAIQHEKEALALYTRIGESLKGKKAEAIFHFLAEEEKKHITSLSTCIDDTPKNHSS